MKGTVDHPGHLLIVTCERTGSTLLASILSTPPGFTIRGENIDCARGLHDYWIALHHTYLQQATARQPSSPFFNELDFDAIKSAMRSLLRATLDPQQQARVVGYKEVRYRHYAGPRLTEYLNFLWDLLSPRMIYLTRGMDDLLTSAIWRNNVEQSRTAITEFGRRWMLTASCIQTACSM